MSTSKLNARQLRKFRSEVAKLKAAGLVSKNKDARSQKPTRYMRAKVEANRDVLEGRAKVLHAKNKTQAAEYSKAYRTQGKNVVVPTQRGERVRIDKRTGDIKGRLRDSSGRSVETIHLRDPDDVSQFPSGPGITYAIQIGNAIHREETMQDMLTFMYPYEQSKTPYKHWRRYVTVERNGRDYSLDDEEA